MRKLLFSFKALLTRLFALLLLSLQVAGTLFGISLLKKENEFYQKENRLPVEAACPYCSLVFRQPDYCFINKISVDMLTVILLAAGLILFWLFYKSIDWFENI
ncbi:MAG TPA: hypothetical protein PK977_04285 [Chitinophagaceae bacterium]|nr:hypothetical protein [Chitinophagaceae bacterium]